MQTRVRRVSNYSPAPCIDQLKQHNTSSKEVYCGY